MVNKLSKSVSLSIWAVQYQMMDIVTKRSEAELRWQRVFQDRKKLLIGKMNPEQKKRIVKCLVWSVATYAAETWTLTAMDKRRTEASEMCIWRRMRGSVTWIK